MTSTEQRIKDAWKHFQDRLTTLKQKAMREALVKEQSESDNELEQLRKKL